ncbi:MAG: hypothetical protein KDK78_08125 [Chlamydiia bacterium]|nr:hypothetical protein [Chlamydiia bacterium]
MYYYSQGLDKIISARDAVGFAANPPINRYSCREDRLEEFHLIKRHVAKHLNPDALADYAIRERKLTAFEPEYARFDPDREGIAHSVQVIARTYLFIQEQPDGEERKRIVLRSIEYADPDYQPEEEVSGRCSLHEELP